MPKATQPKEGLSATGREKTWQLLINKLQDPAYVLVFGIGLLGGSFGLGATAVGFWKGNDALVKYGFASWVLLLIAAVLVIAIQGRKGRDDDLHKSDGTNAGILEFRDQVKGYWWERVMPDHPYISFLNIDANAPAGTVTMNATAFDSAGNIAVEWHSDAAVLKASRIICYIWTGKHTDQRSVELRGGFGELRFTQSSGGRLQVGAGDFVDFDKNLREHVEMKAVQLRRCTEDEIAVMESSRPESIKALIARKLERGAAASSPA